MNLILHHAWKDIRAVRWPLALWLAVLATNCTAQALKVDRFVLDTARLDTLYDVLSVVGYGIVALGWVLAAGIVQADPLDSPSAFWLTRPLSPRALLASKLLVAVPLFLLLPVAGASLVAWVDGASGLRLLTFAAERLVLDAAFMLPVLVAASITHNLARTILVLAVGLLLYACVHSLAFMPFAWVIRPGPARALGFLVAILWSIVCGLGLLWHQYLTRATRRTMWLAAAAIVVAVLAGDFWFWDFVRRAAPARIDARLFDPAKLTLSIDPDSLRRSRSRAVEPMPVSGGGVAERAAVIDTAGIMHAAGVPVGWVIRIGRGRGELRVGDEVIETDGPEPRASARFATPGIVAVGTFRDVDMVHALEPFPREGVIDSRAFGADVRLFTLPEALFHRLEGASASLRATVPLTAERAVLSTPIPLTPGASTRLAGESVTILATDRAVREVVVKVRVTRPRVVFARWTSTFIVLRNRRTGEAVIGTSGPASVGRLGLLPSDVDAKRTTLELRPQAADSRWLADAELLIAVLEPVGTFEKTVVLQGFVLPQMYYYSRN